MRKNILICFCALVLVAVLSLCGYIGLKIQRDSKNKNNSPIQASSKSQIGFGTKVLDEGKLRELIGAENSNYKIINTKFINSNDAESTKIFVELFVPKTLLDKLEFDSDFQITPIYEESVSKFGLDLSTVRDIGIKYNQYVIEENDSTSYRPYCVWWMLPKEPSKSGANVYIYTAVADEIQIQEIQGDGSPVS